jgi:hypothetical protein
VLITLLVIFCNLSICLAQGDDYERKGSVISKGSNRTPVGELKVTTYRLEVIKLTKPFNLGDDKPPIETAFLIVIMTDEPLPFGNVSVWLDDKEIQPKRIQPNAFAIILYARTLQNGMTLALSKRGERDLTARSVLPETLNVPDAYATSLQEIEENRPVIQLRRLARIPRIQIRIKIPNRRCVTGNNVLVVEIDGKEFDAGCDDGVITRMLLDEEFAQLRDGAEIALKYGFGRNARNRRIVGRLDKSSLDR